MKNITRILLIFGVLFSACEKEEHAPNFSRSADNIIRFDALKTGQRSRYLPGLSRLDSKKTSIDYSRDTLEVWIEREAEQGYLVRETYSAGSEIKYWSESQSCDTLNYYLRIERDTIFLSPAGPSCSHSNLFAFLPRQLPLDPPAGPLAQVRGLNVGLPRDENGNFLSGHVVNFPVLGILYPSLHVVRDHSAMAVDGVGLALFYSAEQGVVRAVLYDGWSGNGATFDLLGAE